MKYHKDMYILYRPILLIFINDLEKGVTSKVFKFSDEKCKCLYMQGHTGVNYNNNNLIIIIYFI